MVTQDIIDKFRKIVTEKNVQTTQIMTLLGASNVINSSLEISEIKKQAIETATLLVNAEYVVLFKYDPGSQELIFDTISEKAFNKLEDLSQHKIKLNEGIPGFTAKHEECVIINEPDAHSSFNSENVIYSNLNIRNIISLPVISKGSLIGVLNVINKRTGFFTEADGDLLAALSHQIAVALENAGLYADLKCMFYSIINAMATAIETRDPYTGGHTQRVQDYSMTLGRLIRLSEEDLSRLEIAAILHDIGKIGIEDAILRKIDRLSDEEYTIIQKHPQVGIDILKNIKGIENALPGIKHHHEWYDGTGYPDGQKGQEIDIIARIIAAADAFDAMTSSRSYRNRMTVSQAVDELKRHSGTQFDPLIVDTFLQAFEQGLIDPDRG